LVSTSRFNETNAKAELWFTLLICGEKYPIISNLEFSGLITAFTNLNVKDIISKIKNILNKNPHFFQYILKIIPINYVCATNIQTISEIVERHYREFIKENESFKIKLNRRKHEELERDAFINIIAKKIKNRVDLKKPDIVVRFEILGNFCGISFLRSEDFLRFKCRTTSN